MPFSTPSPFLFCVYHRDAYPAGDDQMRAPRPGNGMDFNPSAPYRMYHGTEGIPGFPQHPHRGFETLTATLVGVVDHTDSQGNAGRYGEGDLQWMTAGSGVVHGEMFPLLHNDKPNPLQLFQIWLNLPRASKMVNPSFRMHWAEEQPVLRTDDGLVAVTVWAGQLDGTAALPPPPNSYAADDKNAVAVWLLRLKPGGSYTLPPANSPSDDIAEAAAAAKINRALYVVEAGPTGVVIAGQAVGASGVLERADVDAAAPVTVTYPLPPPLSPSNEEKKAEAKAEEAGASSSGGGGGGTEEALILVLQGKPIEEPVVQHGPFVMNTQTEIRQAFEDYRKTQFGGWPWDSDAPVFPRDKGRFALSEGVESRPPPPAHTSESDPTAAAVTSKDEL